MKKLISILLTSIMLVTFVTPVGAAGNKAVPALNLDFGDVEWLFAIDRKNETYTGIYKYYGNPKNLEHLIGLLNGLGAVTPLPSGKTAEGDIVVKQTDGARYSYKLESGNILNINGERYRLSENQAQRFTALCKMIRNNDDADIFPKWIAWMQPSNVVSFTEYQPLIPSYNESAFDDPLEFMTQTLFWFGKITKGERYEPGHTGLKKDKEYHELTINFKSGVVYRLKSNGNILCVESSDKKYGCKYTLDFKDGDNDYVNIRTAYDELTFVVPMDNPPT